MFANAMKTMLDQTNKAFDNMSTAAGKMANMAGTSYSGKGDGAATGGGAKK